MNKRWVLSVVLIVGVAASAAHAEITLRTDDVNEWQDAVDGNFHYTDFTQHDNGTWLTTQYQDWGIRFIDLTQVSYSGMYLHDGVGIQGFGEIVIDFDEPIYSIGMDHPHWVNMTIQFADGTNEFEAFAGGGFSGLVFDRPIDWIRIDGHAGSPGDVDNLYIGHAIVPAPGVLAALPLLLLAGRRSRG